MADFHAGCERDGHFAAGADGDDIQPAWQKPLGAKPLDGPFGIMRPDFIGWEGGVAIHGPDGTLFAAAFSGFRGEKDVEIVVRAAAKIPGLRVKVD